MLDPGVFRDMEKGNLMIRPDTPPLPSGTKPLSHQVAGMKYRTSKSKFGFLQLEDGTILKPVQKPPRGDRELRFYQTVFNSSCTDPTILKLRQFLAKYIGVWSCPEQPGVRYIHMEDVTRHFKKPCIADIKVGSRRLDPETPTPPGTRTKYHTVWEMGFQIQGLRIYHPVSGQIVTHDKKYGKRLTETTVIQKGIGLYLNGEEYLRKDIAKAFVNKLLQLKSWFQCQRNFVFYSMSVLLVYEGAYENDTLYGNNNNNVIENKKVSDLVKMEPKSICEEHLVDVKLIDFAFVFPSEEKDESTIEGLTNLINAFKQLTYS